MGKADLQIHSNAGDGLDSMEEILEHVETRTDLDVIALTDHDAVRPAMAMRELAARRGARVEVVIGIEVTTISGDPDPERNRSAGVAVIEGRGIRAVVGDPPGRCRARDQSPGVDEARVGEHAVGARALPRGQPAFVDEVGVGLGHRIARQSEVRGETAGRRKHRPRSQSTRSNGVAKGSEQDLPRAAHPRFDDLAQVEVQVATAGIGP